MKFNSIYRGKIISVDEINHRAQVRVPPIDGGETDPYRVSDDMLSLYKSIVSLSKSDIGSIVFVMYEGENTDTGVILGKLWWGIIDDRRFSSSNYF